MSVKSYLKRGLRFITTGIPSKQVFAQVSTLAPNELLKDRVALVTGGTSGIGYEIAKSFLNAGAVVIITGRSKERIEKARMELDLAAKGRILGIVLDNTKVSDFKDKLNEIIRMLNGKKLDILVNNAGIRGAHIAKATEEEYDNVMDTNLKGTFFLTKLVAKYMIAEHVNGNILNISSSSSIRPALSAYHMSKWAVRGLTEGLARALAPYNICVNAIAPGPTATPMLRGNNNSDDVAHSRNLLGRFILPSEIGNMAVILVSNMSRSIIGDTIYMSGGGGIITNEDVDYNFE